MKRTAGSGWIVLITLALASTSSIAEDHKASLLIQSADNKWTFEGDPKGAIALYEQAVNEAGANSALKAKALLKLGDAYKKRSDDKAIAIFERLTSDFANQLEAGEARARLVTMGNMRTGASSNAGYMDSPPLTDKSLWSDDGTDVSGRVSSDDGRFLSFVDRSKNGDLSIRDLVSKENKDLFKAGDGIVGPSAISRDGKYVAFAWRPTPQSTGELRVVGRDGTVRLIFSRTELDSIQPVDWTPNGKIVVLVSSIDGASRIETIDARDGEITNLKAFFGSEKPGGMTTSPDGRFIAYDAPRDGTTMDRDIVLLRVEGKVEFSLVQYPAKNTVLGWIDSKRLLFARENGGKTGIWSIETAEGKPPGTPLLVDDKPGAIRSLGLTSGGSLFYSSGEREIRVIQNLLPVLARLQLAASQQSQQQTVPLLASIEGLVVKLGTSEPISGVDVELTRIEGTATAPLAPGAAAAFASIMNPTITSAFSIRPEPPAALAPEIQYAKTGDNGRFVFRNLKPGSYRLVAAVHIGQPYLPARYGQRDPRGSGLSFPITEGQTLRDAKLEMASTGVITGRVLDADGRPLGHTSVMAVRLVYMDGRRKFVCAQVVLSDERGDYRLYSLPPGQYYIAAKVEERNEVFITGIIQNEEFGGSPIVTRKILSSGEVIEETDVLVYRDGTLDPKLSRPVDVGTGSLTFTGIDIPLNAGKVRSYHIRGLLINGVTGMPAAGVQIRAVPLKQSPQVFIPFGVTDAEGAFDLSGAVPGKYVVFSSNFRSIAPTAQAGRAAAPVQISGQMEIEVTSGDVANLRMVAAAPAALTGLVAIEGRPQGSNDPDLAKVQIALTWDPDIIGMPNTGVQQDPAARATAGVDGSFVLPVTIGNYRVNVNGIPSGAYLKSIRMGDTDILGGGLHIRGTPEGPLEIVIGRNVGEIDGVAINSDLAVMPNVIVALVPESTLLRGRPDLYGSTTTDAKGRFQFRTIPPGKYKLFAWEYAERDSWQDEEFLQPYETSGKPIQVVEGNTQETRVTVSPKRK